MIDRPSHWLLALSFCFACSGAGTTPNVGAEQGAEATRSAPEKSPAAPVDRALLEAQTLEAGAFVVLDDSTGAALSAEGARAARRPEWKPEMGTAWRDPSPTVLAEIVRDHGDLVEVSFPDTIAEDHCTLFHPEAPPTRANWFVMKRSLWPLLARPFATSWPDGTELAVAPGLVAHSDPRGPVWVMFPELGRIEIPASHVALGYRPAGPPEVGVPDAGGPERFEATVGDAKLTLYLDEGTAVGALAGRHRACAGVVAKVVAPDPGAIGGLGHAWKTFPADTPLTDPSGVELARLRAAWTIELRQEPDGGRYCIGRNMRGFGPYVTELCLPADVATRGESPFPEGRLRY